jgi:hypothetical protein
MDLLKEAERLRREGACRYCLHPVSGPPHWRFERALRRVLRLRRDYRAPLVPGLIEAHLECLNDHASDMPDSPDDLETIWRDGDDDVEDDDAGEEGAELG